MSITEPALGKFANISRKTPLADLKKRSYTLWKSHKDRRWRHVETAEELKRACEKSASLIEDYKVNFEREFLNYARTQTEKTFKAVRDRYVNNFYNKPAKTDGEVAVRAFEQLENWRKVTQHISTYREKAELLIAAKTKLKKARLSVRFYVDAACTVSLHGLEYQLFVPILEFSNRDPERPVSWQDIAIEQGNHNRTAPNAAPTSSETR